MASMKISLRIWELCLRWNPMKQEYESVVDVRVEEES